MEENNLMYLVDKFIEIVVGAVALTGLTAFFMWVMRVAF